MGRNGPTSFLFRKTKLWGNLIAEWSKLWEEDSCAHKVVSSNPTTVHEMNIVHLNLLQNAVLLVSKRPKINAKADGPFFNK